MVLLGGAQDGLAGGHAAHASQDPGVRRPVRLAAPPARARKPPSQPRHVRLVEPPGAPPAALSGGARWEGVVGRVSGGARGAVGGGAHEKIAEKRAQRGDLEPWRWRRRERRAGRRKCAAEGVGEGGVRGGEVSFGEVDLDEKGPALERLSPRARPELPARERLAGARSRAA